MLKFNFLLLFFTCQSIVLFSQSESNYKIVYKGFVNLSKPGQINQVGTLVYTQHTSEWFIEMSDNYVPINNDSIVTVPISKGKLPQVFKNYDDSSLIFQYNTSFIPSKGKNYYADTLNAMKWELTDRQKKIDSIDCYKAITHFRGRYYEAWFAPSIPISEGPWKFGGLPGLILEIADTAKHVYWKFVSLTRTHESPDPIPKPRMNFDEFKKAFKKGVTQFSQSIKSEDAIDPTCATCGKDVKSNVQTIENLTD